MLDIDNFKKVNDVYGHKEGDIVIIALSDVLRKITENIPNASVGRWGGEEFMVLLTQNDINEAIETAEKIRTAFAEMSFPNAGHQTVSIGVTQAKKGESTDSICTRVDKALYMAKEAGKNRVIRLD